MEGSHRKGKLEAPRSVPQELQRERKAGAIPLQEHHSGRAGEVASYMDGKETETGGNTENNRPLAHISYMPGLFSLWI